MSEPKHTRIKPAHLQTLAAVVRYGNFGEAALELGLSQSAVSYSIATLENELGVMLLHRGRSGATLTAAGESVMGLAEQVLDLLSQIVQVSTAHRGLQGGRVRVGVFRSVGTYLLPAAIAQFRDRCPQIAVTITEFADSAAVQQALKTQAIDLGFTDESSIGSEFELRPLFDDPYVVLLPPGSGHQGQPLTWQDLAAYPLLSEAPGNVWYTRLKAYLKSCGVALTVAYEIREDSTRVGMVAQGLGAAIIPRLAAEPIPPGVLVGELPVPFQRPIGIALLAESIHPPAVFAFVETLVQHTQVRQGSG